MGQEKKQSFQKYAQVPYKPFAYQEGTGTLNFRILANVEPEQLFSSGDLETAQTVLKNFQESQLPANMEFEVFSKLLRFSQLGIAHFAAQQTIKQQALDENYLKFKNLQEQDAHLEELKNLHAEKKPQYEEELKSLSVRVKELKKKSQSMGSYKCVYCGKTYTDKDTLESHSKRRHIDQLNEIYDTQEMLKKNSDPVAGLKKKQFDEMKKQNEIELEKIDKVQKVLQQQNINEDKLIQEISSKLKEDFFAKLKVIQSQLQDSQMEVSAVEDSQVHQSVDRSKGNNNNNSQSNQDEEQNNNPPGSIEPNKQVQLSKKNPKLEDQIQKMASNFESVYQALQKIKESQDLMDQQSKEYQMQLKRIADGQEELRKSGIAFRQQASKESEAGGFQGSMISNAQVPRLNSRKTSLVEQFPIQGLPTADFSRNSLLGANKFFEKPLQNTSTDQQDDSFLNNSNINNNNEENRNINHQQTPTPLPLSIIASQQQQSMQMASPQQGMINSFMRPKVFHIGDLEEDYNSEDEKRKAYHEQMELKANKKHQQQSSQGRQSSEKTHSKNPSLMMLMQEGSFKKKQQQAGGMQKSENFIMPHSEVYSDSNSRRESKQTVQSDEEDGEIHKKTAGSMKNIKPDETTKKQRVLKNQMSFGQKYDIEKHDDFGRKSAFGGKVYTDESINNLTGESPIKLEDMAGKLSSRDKLSRQSSQNNNLNGSKDMIRQNSNSELKDNTNSKLENDRNYINNNNQIKSGNVQSGILDSQGIGLPPPPPLANKQSVNNSSRNIGAASSNSNPGNQQSESIFDKNSKQQKMSLNNNKDDSSSGKPKINENNLNDLKKRKQQSTFKNPGNNEIDEIRRDLNGDISKDSNLNTSRSENVPENPAKKRIEDLLKNDADDDFAEGDNDLEGKQKNQQIKKENDKADQKEEDEDF